jgi:hypothetical protein
VFLSNILISRLLRRSCQEIAEKRVKRRGQKRNYEIRDRMCIHGLNHEEKMKETPELKRIPKQTIDCNIEVSQK